LYEQVVKLAEETLSRYKSLTEELSDPEIYSDQRRYTEVAKEHARLRRGAELCDSFLEALREGREARETASHTHNFLIRGITRTG